MHMAMVIGGGLGLLAIFLLFGKLWGGAEPAYGIASRLFIPVWLAVAATNMWVGVTKAGYPVREELLILAIVALVPIAAAVLVAWRLVR
jgi:hypothetical protein